MTIAWSRGIRRIRGHRRHHLRAGNLGNIRPNAVAAHSPMNFAAVAEHTFSSLPSMRGGRRGVRKGGLMGRGGGGDVFESVTLLKKLEVRELVAFFGLLTRLVRIPPLRVHARKFFFLLCGLFVIFSAFPCVCALV